MLERDVFSKKEAGDYINDKFIFYKVELDKNDKENLSSKFKIEVYPTFIVIDSHTEKEHTRFTSGAGKTVETFIGYIKDNLNPEMSIEWQDAKYRKDINYGDKYVKFLLERRMNIKAQEIIEDMFMKEPFEKKITESRIDYYNKRILTMDSPIIDYLVDNKDAVMRKVGKIPYEAFFINRSTKALGVMNAREIKINDIALALKNFDTRPHLVSKYSTYLTSNFDNIKGDEKLALIKSAQKAVVVATSMERSHIVSVILRFVVGKIGKKDKSYNEELVNLYDICYKNETTPASRERYYNRIQKLLN